MLRCTLAGMIPLMKSQKYNYISEEIYDSRLEDFNKIREKKSYYLIPSFTIPIAEAILEPMIPDTVRSQKQNGIWGKQNNVKLTYEILSALKYTDRLDSLYHNKQLNDSRGFLEDKTDYYSIMIKKEVYQCLTDKDISVIQEMIDHIIHDQKIDGSWEGSVIATVYHIEKLLKLGVPKDDKTVLKGVDYLLDSFIEESEAYQKNGPYGLKIENVFTKERMLEFEKAEKYYEDFVPRSKCFQHIAIMQNSKCIQLLLALGYESNDKVEKSMDSMYKLYSEYGGLCISDIKNKYLKK